MILCIWVDLNSVATVTIIFAHNKNLKTISIFIISTISFCTYIVFIFIFRFPVTFNLPFVTMKSWTNSWPNIKAVLLPKKTEKASQAYFICKMSWSFLNLTKLIFVRPKELNKLLASVTIAQKGVMPNIQAVLLPKKTEKATKTFCSLISLA